MKVNRYLEHAAAPDRLLHPLRRVGAKGEGRFERVTWEEALDEIASRWQDIIRTHGPEAIWPFQGTGNFGFVHGDNGQSGSRLWNVLGTSRHEAESICSAAGRDGLTYTLGAPLGMDPETFNLAKLILLWGTNTLTSDHHLWKYVVEARRNGAHVVVIDPVRTRTAEKADEHVAPMPGTDAALALGLLNVVIELGAEDRDYIDRCTFGWTEFRRRIEQFPPQRVAQITDVPETQIRALGERLASSRPTAIRALMGLQRHAGGGTALRTLACVPGVTGDWQYPGGGVAYSVSSYFGANHAALTRPDLRRSPARLLYMTRLGDGLLTLDDPTVMSLFVYGANPVVSNPDQNRVRAGLRRDDLFTVVVEHFATDTVDYADLVLPATMQTEHHDLHNGYGHLYLARNEPAAHPPGECLTHTEIFRRIARRMSLDEPALHESDEDLARHALDSDSPSLEGITLDRLREAGWLRLNLPRPFVPFADGFPTPSGRLEFVSARAAEDGLDPVAGYVPPAESAVSSELAAQFPFVLVAQGSHYFLNSTFANNEHLGAKAGAPRVRVHPVDAAARGLVDAGMARVFNARGAFEARVTVTDAARPGVVATTKGHWSKLAGTGVGTVNATTPERDADMGGAAVFHDSRVQLEPTVDAVA